MKKVKNSELNQVETPVKGVEEGKIKKNKQKKNKKLQAVAKKLADQELAPKIEQAVVPSKNNGGADIIQKKKKKNKNKLAQQTENQKTEDSAKVGNEETQPDKKKKRKKFKKEKTQQGNPATTAPPKESEGNKELTEAERKKIEKKKAKKLAQKLKKQQKQAQKPETTKEELVKTNGVKKDKPASKDTDSATTKVLSKKEKKAKKRQLLKEQKLAEKQTRDPAQEAATVFVGNLPVNTKRVQIIRLFKDFAPVNSIRLRSAGGKVLHKHKQRKDSGSLNGYVVLKDKATAEKAVSLNGVEFKGHHLRVTLASKSPQHHEKEESKRTVFVGNLKYSATEEALREIFSSCGDIDYVRCLRDGDKGCKGVAYVCFKTPDSVGLALELNETMLDERPIHVERYSVRKLGAKEARDAQAEKEQKSKKGAKQRVDGKKGKPASKKVIKNDANEEDKKPKKSEFRGVKVEALKKKQKLKKKKSKNQMTELAKKIAPKSKSE